MRPAAINPCRTTRRHTGRLLQGCALAALIGAPTADLLDGGIGSNIDLRTADALDTEPFATMRLYTHYENRTEENTPNGSLSAG